MIASRGLANRFLSRGLTAALLLAFLLPLIVSTPAHADPAGGGAGAGHPGNPALLVLAGPFWVLFSAGMYAVLSIFAILARSERRLSAFIASCAMRADERRAIHVLWGLALAVLILAVGGTLLKYGGLRWLGVLILLAGATAAGLGSAAAASNLSRRWAMSNPDAQPVQATDLPRGYLLMVLAAMVPVLGWFAAALVGLSGLGAVAEQAIVGRQVADAEKDRLPEQPRPGEPV